ncbi:MAG TPA: beta-propeller domain-containing protein [Syntrophomonadaceae bacterium]|nr:beta-propeller domain-containing protein [Syntrophomonadaceae bacterium]
MAGTDKKRLFLMPTLLVLALILTAGSLAWSIPDRTASSAPSPPRVGSREKLVELLREYQVNWEPRVLEETKGITDTSKNIPMPVPATEAANGSDYSQTNTQVEGVDEADLVKTDGQYIYQVNGSRVLIIRALPASQMQVAAEIKMDDSSFNPQEIYVDAGRLVLIGQSSQGPFYEPYLEDRKSFAPPLYPTNTTRALIYDISDPGHPYRIREVALEGSYLSSRKIGSSLYLVSNRPINTYRIQNDDQLLQPCYLDSAAGNTMKPIDYDKIFYFPGYVYPNYIMVAAVDLDSTKGIDVQSYLGRGDNIYASTNRLYIALTSYAYETKRSGDSAYLAPENKTLLHCFDLKNGSIQYAAQGEVPGTIINQFSMDEYQGCFRIATTTGEAWQQTSQNNIYILDESLAITGRLEGIAPGEKIYSTRFMGNRAFMVTFRTVDPFFVIDLSNPEQPAILGKLKIPGFSDYLHPYDENHIIGFGKDTVELKDVSGDNRAYYQGLKVALFDVSDVNNPVEMSRQIIGDRGTDSELLTNHKALLFSRDKNLLAFPVTVMTTGKENQTTNQTPPPYGSFSFQGAYIYHVDLENGLQFKGRISHLSSEDYSKAGDYWYDSDRNVQRILFINDTIYTLSRAMIQAHNLPYLIWTGNLILPTT